MDLTIGPNTWPIPCHGLIATPGAVDSHVHLLSPRLVPVALSAGVTTLITAGFEEPPWRMLRTLEAFEHLPVNIGLQPSARTGVPGQLEAAIEAGAVGLKIHEDWGAYPEVIDEVLRAADAHDIQVCLHTDGLNESCELAGHGRGDRGTGDPRVPRRGLGWRPHPRPDRDRPRAERLLLLHHTDDPLRAVDRPPSSST